MSSPAPAVTRAAQILRLLADDRPAGLTLSDLARQAEVAKSSVANLLDALERAELVARVDGRYRLGHATLELGSSYLRAVPFLHEFGDGCRRLASASSETLLLGQLEDTDVLYLARHDGSQPVRLASDVGRRLPANCTALGKAMLATLDPGLVRERYRRLPAFPRLSPNSLPDLDALADDLEGARERGYAVDDEENTVGVTCFGVAVPRMQDGEPLRAVSATLLKARATPGLRAELVSELRELAASLALRSSMGAAGFTT